MNKPFHFLRSGLDVLVLDEWNVHDGVANLKYHEDLSEKASVGLVIEPEDKTPANESEKPVKGHDQTGVRGAISAGSLLLPRQVVPDLELKLILIAERRIDVVELDVKFKCMLFV